MFITVFVKYNRILYNSEKCLVLKICGMRREGREFGGFFWVGLVKCVINCSFLLICSVFEDVVSHIAHLGSRRSESSGQVMSVAEFATCNCSFLTAVKRLYAYHRAH
jgi:hypothetical protein